MEKVAPAKGKGALGERRWLRKQEQSQSHPHWHQPWVTASGILAKGGGGNLLWKIRLGRDDPSKGKARGTEILGKVGGWWNWDVGRMGERLQGRSMWVEGEGWESELLEQEELSPLLLHPRHPRGLCCPPVPG
jgi:hypothetical protein